MASEERDVQVDGVTLRVREAGAADEEPVIHFHGTPGSRLEMAWADEVISAAGVRLIAFDRPGYGAATQASFSLGSVARMTLEVADQVGLEQCCCPAALRTRPPALRTEYGLRLGQRGLDRRLGCRSDHGPLSRAVVVWQRGSHGPAGARPLA
jgi:hypothetical protein